MLGSERRSLLDGEISRREATARDAVDQLLGKLVDAFNFQIQEQQLESAHRQHEQDKEQRQQRIKSDKERGSDYVGMELPASNEVLSPRASSPAQAKTRSSFLLKRLSEKLSEFVLNESIDQAAKENPMELGWARSSTAAASAQQRSSWLDDLRERVTLSSEKDLKDKQRESDDDDAFFQTDDESSGYCNYQIMA